MTGAKYSDGENTVLAREDMYSFDYSDYDVPEIEYMNAFDDVRLFYDAVLQRARELGFCGGENKALVSFLCGLCRDAGVNVSRQTLTNWLTEGAPSGDARCRENVYKLCFALKFDERAAERFFIKAYLEKPYNYKNINESVYYFCLKNGMGYGAAESIIARVNEAPDADNPFAETDTVMIGSAVASVKTEKELVRYLVENRAGFRAQNVTATNKVLYYIEKNIEIANKEKDKFELKDGDGKDAKPKVKNAESLLSAICGYSIRNKTYYPQSISKSKLPKYVKTNFPQAQQLKNIKDGKGTYDSIRKALAVMVFYNFFGNVLVNDVRTSPDKLFKEFVDEFNAVLAACGYVQAYWRNPFDWIIGHCASHRSPLDEFRSIIQIFYLDETE